MDMCFVLNYWNEHSACSEGRKIFYLHVLFTYSVKEERKSRASNSIGLQSVKILFSLKSLVAHLVSDHTWLSKIAHKSDRVKWKCSVVLIAAAPLYINEYIWRHLSLVYDHSQSSKLFPWNESAYFYYCIHFMYGLRILYRRFNMSDNVVNRKAANLRQMRITFTCNT